MTMPIMKENEFSPFGKAVVVIGIVAAAVAALIKIFGRSAESVRVRHRRRGVHPLPDCEALRCHAEAVDQFRYEAHEPRDGERLSGRVLADRGRHPRCVPMSRTGATLTQPPQGDSGAAADVVIATSRCPAAPERQR